eukprot:g6040.t1
MSQARTRGPQAKQEANNGGTGTHSSSSRRRRRGGTSASASASTSTSTAARQQSTTLPQHNSGGRTASNGAGGGGGGGRGGGNRKIWEENPAPPPAAAQSSKGDGGRRKGGTSGRRGGAGVAPPAGGGGTGGQSAGERGGRGGGSGAVHPGMLESEFLAATTGQAGAGAEGGAAVSSSLSLEEVPYDRDLRWCNTASDSRPRPKMDPSGGVFGRVGTAITQDTGDYERLDRHYQELWKDRDPGRGGRSGRGGGGRGGGRVRRVRGPGGRNANNVPAGFATIAAASARGGRGDGPAGGATIREGAGGRGGGGRGGGACGSPAASRNAAGAVAELGRGGGGGERGSAGHHRNRPQRANGAGRVGAGRPAGAGGGRSSGAPTRSSPPRSANRVVPQVPPPSSAPSYPANGGPVAVAVQPRAVAPRTAQALNNVRGWSEGLDHQQHREKNGGGGGGVSSHPLGTWAMEPSSGKLPETAAGAAVINGGVRGAGVGTPPLVPAMPSQFAQSFPPESPEYLSDLANVLSSTPPPLYGGQRQHQLPQQQPQAVTPPLGSLLGGGDLFSGSRGRGEGRAGVLTPKQDGGGAVLSPFLSPRQSTLLADPSLDVDIQDICADPDLNADAPAFVPGGY